jgi:hypothetical protein
VCVVCCCCDTAGFAFACADALVVQNTGNVPLAFNGLVASDSLQLPGPGCATSGLDPFTSLTCSFIWAASAADAQAGTSSIFLQVSAHDVGPVADYATVFSGSAMLPVPQQPLMGINLVRLTSETPSSNSEWGDGSNNYVAATALVTVGGCNVMAAHTPMALLCLPGLLASMRWLLVRRQPRVVVACDSAMSFRSPR